jgi:hypothetical protein
MSCYVMSCHVMSCHVMSCHVMSYYIILYYNGTTVVYAVRRWPKRRYAAHTCILLDKEFVEVYLYSVLLIYLPVKAASDERGNDPLCSATRRKNHDCPIDKFFTLRSCFMCFLLRSDWLLSAHRMWLFALSWLHWHMSWSGLPLHIFLHAIHEHFHICIETI